jgi:ABC-type multidrug transport system ATPase subunit/pSer/pThr/pTyr-binding forkhead associated (FHA) protein
VWIEIKTGTQPSSQVKLREGVNSVGRELQCVVPLADRFVSRVHFNLILQPDGSLVLEDLGSMNGTFLNGQKMSGARFLNVGDLITIGETSLRVIQQPNQDVPQTLMGNDPSIEYRMKIGRDVTNDLVIPHPLVSRFHAEVIFRDGKYIIYDLGSINGVHVNGKRVSGKAVVEFGDRIQIGGSTFRFQGKPVYESNDYSVDLHVQHLERVVTKADQQQEKLLNNISFHIEAREFVAILGESGAGKSTLLGALTGMSPATSGEILLNGQPFYEEYDYFRTHIGYVPQDDIVHMDLTVFEVLDYSARLRLPSDFSEEELVQRVNEVIEELELTGRRDQLVRNLSGGQRKRVSIGVELLTKPSLFFLDEPTSGLDPGLEKLMMENLRKLANAGKTILMVTHATFNIDMCDKVIILGKGGRLAFFGTPAEALSFFDVNNFAEIYKNMTLTDDPTTWPSRYNKSKYCEKYRGTLKNGGTRSQFSSTDGKVSNQRTSNKPLADITSQTANRSSAWKQWRLLTSRYAKIMMRDKKNMSILFLQAIVIALLLVAVFFEPGGLFDKNGAGGDIQANMESWNQMSLTIALMIFTAIWLGTSNAAREITKELPIYLRERRVYLKILPYFFSKMAVLSLISLLQLILFLGILTIGLGLPNPFLHFAAFFLITLCSIMMGLLVSAFVSNSDKAISLVPLLLVPQIILSGAIVHIDKVEPAISAIFYLAISHWGYVWVGADIVGVDDLSGYTGYKALEGPASLNWIVLVAFMLAFLFATVWAIARKDRKS